MWTRKQIKTDAKEFLRKNYWKSFLVCLLVGLLGVGMVFINTANEAGLNAMDPALMNSLLVGSIVSMVLALLNALLTVGVARFFLEGYKGQVEIDTLFSVFAKKEWWEIIKTQFVVSLYIFLWSLLLVIPGIIKSFEYYFVPYILAEDPSMPTKEAIALSRKMTYGHKMDIFILTLSFFWWDLFGVLTLGIGGLFVMPYKKATEARLYNLLSDISTVEDARLY